MKLASEDQMAALDARFGRMASAVGRHAWSLPQLTMREKTLVFIAADLRTGGLGFPLATHIQMGATQGVAAADCRAAIRHLAPYVGYPTAAVALQQLGELEAQLPQAARQAPRPQPAGERVVLPDPARRRLSDLDEDFAAFYAEQFEQRWGDGELAPRERALCCIAVDALDQTLDEPFELHVRLAHAAARPRPTFAQSCSWSPSTASIRPGARTAPCTTSTRVENSPWLLANDRGAILPGMPVTERSAPTRRAILVAARQSFAANGYQATTIRGVAAAAGIDPSMVMRYYGSKAGLFRAAIDVDLHLPELAGQPPQRLGEVLAWHFVTRWEGRLADEAITLLLRSAVARDDAAEQMRTIFAAQVLGAIESLVGQSQETTRRAGMIGSQLLGLALARYVLRLPPVAAMDAPTLVATVAPVLQHYLTGDLTGPVSGDHASAGPNSAKPRSRRPLPDSDDAPTAHE